MIGLGFASDLFFFIIFGKLGSYSLKTWSAIFHGRGWHIYAGAEYPKLVVKGLKVILTLSHTLILNIYFLYFLRPAF